MSRFEKLMLALTQPLALKFDHSGNLMFSSPSYLGCHEFKNQHLTAMKKL